MINGETHPKKSYFLFELTKEVIFAAVTSMLLLWGTSVISDTERDGNVEAKSSIDLSVPFIAARLLSRGGMILTFSSILLAVAGDLRY